MTENIVGISQRVNIFQNLRVKLLNNKKLYNKKGKVNSNIFKMITKEERDQLVWLFPKISSAGRLYCIINNILDLPKCLECGNEVTLFYGSSIGFSNFCSMACSRKNNISKNKRKATNLKLYGFENCRQAPSVIAKYEETCLEKYGYTNPVLNKDIQSKISDTLKQTYQESGKEIKAARNTTFIKRYGEHPNKTEFIQNKRKHAVFEKYGVEHTTQLDSTKEKSKATMLKNFGNTNYWMSDIGRGKRSEILIRKKEETQEKRDLIVDGIKKLPFQKMTRTEIAQAINLPLTSCNFLIREYNLSVKEEIQQNKSSVEIEIVEFIKSLRIKNLIPNDRKMLEGKEIDIFLPDYNLAIEVDGIYWHSEKWGKDSKYHLDKTIKCNQKNINLLHIFDSEWMDKRTQEIWKSIIKSKLQLNTKIYARKCEIKNVSTTEAAKFLNENHLQGFLGGSIKLGLYHNNILVQLVILNKSRYNKKYDLELIRSASLGGFTIVGGLSKLLSKVLGSIISYADLRYSIGTGYEKIGMARLKNTVPNYFYIIDGKLESRLKYQKHKLVNLLEEFDPNLTESHNMNNHGIYRIWDCGNGVFVRNK